MAEQIDVAEVRRGIAERGQAYISEATGFDSGDPFADAAEVRGYFSEPEIRLMFGHETLYTQEALDAMADAVIEHRWHMAVPTGPTYEAVRYAADGHEREQDPGDPAMTDGAVLTHGTMEECRAAVARRVLWEIYSRARERDEDIGAVLLSRLRWDGAALAQEGEVVVEAYHDHLRDEPRGDGCGGWYIRRATPTA